MSNIDTDTLTARRLEFVRTLESDTFRQGCGTLFNATFDAEDGYSEEDAAYCCLGVGRELIDPGYFFTSDFLKLTSTGIGENDYDLVRGHYVLSADEQEHLIAMNDGRHRNFPFIARFLRKVWGLTGA